MCLAAEREEILIDRPGGRMLRLSVVSEADAMELERYLGRPEPFEKSTAGEKTPEIQLFSDETGNPSENDKEPKNALFRKLL